jgi:predicted nucleotidyltransferase
MSRPLLDLSKKIDSGGLIEVCSAISPVANSLGFPFYIVGATARDIVLQCAYNIESSRATVDVDFGVKVSSMSEFSSLKEALVDTGEFQITKAVQRLYFRNGLPVDIVPFGDVSSEGNTIIWPPPNTDIEMNILGFEEAFEHALLVRLSTTPLVEVKVASPVGWALLKIISWYDRPSPECQKDAIDLALIMHKFFETFDLEGLYENEGDLIEEEGFELELVGARLLGRQIQSLAKQQSLTTIREILSQETGEQESYQLILDMITRSIVGDSDQFSSHLLLLEKLYQGIMDDIT